MIVQLHPLHALLPFTTGALLPVLGGWLVNMGTGSGCWG